MHLEEIRFKDNTYYYTALPWTSRAHRKDQARDHPLNEMRMENPGLSLYSMVTSSPERLKVEAYHPHYTPPLIGTY